MEAKTDSRDYAFPPTDILRHTDGNRTSWLTFGDLVDRPEFRHQWPKTAFVAGADLHGRPVYGNVAGMLHTLITGTTGSGKSMLIHSLILSILYHAEPKYVRMCLIDSTGLEMSEYDGIPHLILPVARETDQAAIALNRCAREVLARLQRFRDVGAKNYVSYTAAANDPSRRIPIMPQIIVIIDGFSILMPSDAINQAVGYLVRCGAAAGVYLIVTSQRASADVISGTIKADIPSRVTFRVMSELDSRLVIGRDGAENLTREGSMLAFIRGMQNPQLLQAPRITNTEIKAAVEFVRTHNERENFLSRANNLDTEVPKIDNLFHDAGIFCIENNAVSIGQLQRAFRIGFNRAAGIVDELCDAGVVTEAIGTKPRCLLMDKDEFEQYCQDKRNNIDLTSKKN